MNRKVALVLVVVIGLVAGAAGWAIAQTTTVTAKNPTAIRVIRGPDTVETGSSQTWSTIASATTTVPSNTKAVLLMRFSGSSACWGGGANDYCSVRILVNGNDTQPSDTLPFRFDSVGTASDIWDWESHSMDRSTGVLPAGSYTVQVQIIVSNGLTTFRIDNWSLVIERVRA